MSSHQVGGGRGRSGSGRGGKCGKFVLGGAGRWKEQVMISGIPIPWVCSESDIAIAILRLVEMEKIVVEGAGATGLAACLSGQLDHLKGKT